jgi:hypothetical protein
VVFVLNSRGFGHLGRTVSGTGFLSAAVRVLVLFLRHRIRFGLKVSFVGLYKFVGGFEW